MSENRELIYRTVDFFNNKESKYTLGKEWVIREDPYYIHNFSALNINTSQILYLDEQLYIFFKMMSENALSFNQISVFFDKKRISFDWSRLYYIFETFTPQNLLVRSDYPFILKKINNVNLSLANKYNVPISSTPFDAEIHLTHKCNLKCLHCFQESDPKSNKFSHLEINKWIDIFNQFEQMRMFQIVFSGGEALFYKDFDKLFDEIVHMRLTFNILTNGTLVNKKNIKNLSSPNVRLNISLDGPNSQVHDMLRGNGSFEKTENAIKKLLENDAKINISYTVHKENYMFIQNTVEYLISIGVSSIAFTAIDEMGRAEMNKKLLLTNEEYKSIQKTVEELIDKFQEKIKLSFVNLYTPSAMKYVPLDSIICSAGTRRIAISSDGILYPCVYGFGHKELEIGDLKEKNIIDYWLDSQLWDNYRGKIKINELEFCPECILKDKCTMKGCRLKGYSKEKGIYSKPKICLADRIF